MKTLNTRIASEFLGTGFLVAAVVGSGIAVTAGFANEVEAVNQ